MAWVIAPICAVGEPWGLRQSGLGRWLTRSDGTSPDCGGCGYLSRGNTWSVKIFGNSTEVQRSLECPRVKNGTRTRRRSASALVRAHPAHCRRAWRDVERKGSPCANRFRRLGNWQHGPVNSRKLRKGRCSDMRPSFVRYVLLILWTLLLVLFTVDSTRFCSIPTFTLADYRSSKDRQSCKSDVRVLLHANAQKTRFVPSETRFCSQVNVKVLLHEKKINASKMRCKKSYRGE